MPSLESQEVTALMQYSGVGLQNLDSTGYTIAVTAKDKSTSVKPFESLIEDMSMKIAQALMRDPNADSILLRDIAFATGVEEVHGFLRLADLNSGMYAGKHKSGGSTALYDATFSGLSSLKQEGEKLVQQGYAVNGILIIVTDGDDNQSKTSPAMIKQLREDILTAEQLESLIMVLVGVNIKNPHMKQRLDEFHVEAGFDKFKAIEDATENELAKLALDISQSISSQSQALGTGGPSQQISF